MRVSKWLASPSSVSRSLFRAVLQRKKKCRTAGAGGPAVASGEATRGVSRNGRTPRAT